MADEILLPNGETIKAWSVGALKLAFKLHDESNAYTPTMKQWLTVENPDMDSLQAQQFERMLQQARKNISSWNEETLKMFFISKVLALGYLDDFGKGLVGIFDASLSTEVQGYTLSVKPDFTVATGSLDYFANPYFHFHEYKASKPNSDPLAQVLQAMLVAQAKNKNGKPIYGLTITGASWQFVTLEESTYCTSEILVATRRDDLLKIIAVLRKFRLEILPELVA